MTERFVAIDFAGTLVTPEFINKANAFRAKILNTALPSHEDHNNPEELYKNNRKLVEALTGLLAEHTVLRTELTGEVLEVPGEAFQNIIATNLFMIGCFQAAKELGLKAFPEGLDKELLRLQEDGFTLAIVSGVRSDIISGVLEITGFPVVFGDILGQPATLGVSGVEQLQELQERGEVAWMVGDKESDVKDAKTVGAKSVFVTWGFGEDVQADIVVRSPADLRSIQ